MTLSAADENYRIGKFTGSLANVVMTATTEAALNKAWREKVGLDPPPAETWAMRAGSHMESLILNERELQTGHKITRRGEIVDHPTIPDVCVKLDGYREADDAIIEVKFIAPWRNREEFIPAYAAQVHLQMICVGTRNGVLVVGQGTSDPIEHEIVFDQAYADELLRRAQAFLVCMRTLKPPFIEPEGHLASTEAYGCYGAFQIQGPCGRKLNIIASGGDETGWEHVSVSMPNRMPNWDEMCFVKRLFWEPEECVMQLHPPESEFVNYHRFCLHLWRPVREEIPQPDSIEVGPKIEETSK